MKVYFKYDTKSFPKKDRNSGIVYCYSCNGKICICRNYGPVKHLPQHDQIITMQKLALSIWNALPLRFKNDLSIYTKSYKTTAQSLRSKYISPYSVFLKIVHHLDNIVHFSKISDFSPLFFLKTFHYLSIYYSIKLKLLPSIPNSFKLNKSISSLNNHHPYNFIDSSYKKPTSLWIHDLQEFNTS